MFAMRVCQDDPWIYVSGSSLGEGSSYCSSWHGELRDGEVTVGRDVEALTGHLDGCSIVNVRCKRVFSWWLIYTILCSSCRYIQFDCKAKNNVQRQMEEIRERKAGHDASLWDQVQIHAGDTSERSRTLSFKKQ